MPEQTHSSTPERSALFLLIFLSGAAGLIYEVLWMRQLGLLFGNTAHAAAAVLGTFFLGLALGGELLARRAPRLSDPLRTYVALELGIAGGALLVPWILDLYRALYGPLYELVGDRPALFLGVKLGLSLVVLLPPSICMGGTFPVLAQHLVRQAKELGAMGGRIYAVNTLGATLGAFAAGFLLPRAMGYSGAYAVAVGLSLSVAAGAWVLRRRVGQPTDSASNPPATSASEPIRVDSWLTLLAAGSGFLALALQVLWVRMFSQVLQNSVYTYAAILVVFLLALALGASLAARLGGGDARRRLRDVLSLAAVATAASPFLLYGLTDGLSYAAREATWTSYVVSIFFTVAIVILPAGVLAGTAFPMLFRLAESLTAAPGAILGRLAAVNTVGGIAGSLVAGFAVLELLGLWRGLQAVALGYAVLAAALTWRHAAAPHTAWRRVAWPAVAAGIVLVAFDPSSLATVRVDVDGGERLLGLRQSAHGTVAVVEREGSRRIKLDNHYTLGGTGALDGERRQAHVPLLLHPNPRSVFFLGLGSGLTAGAALEHPVERVVACELVPEVIELARLHFAAEANGLFDDPRVEIVAEDGRNVLLGRRETYDVVIADLFVPWKRGAGALYTREHFEAVRARLAPGGLFAQWVPLYQVSRREFDVLARTMLDVFPQVTLWRGDVAPRETIVALVGHAEATPLDPDALVAASRQLAERREGDQEQLPEAGAFLFYAGNMSTASKLVGSAPVATDARPWIEQWAPVTQRQESAGAVSWMVGEELIDFYADLLAAVPLETDPYLAQLGARQQGYVEAGWWLHRANVLHAAGAAPEASAAMAEAQQRLGLSERRK